MYNLEMFKKESKNIGYEIFINEPMSKHTTFKIGGNADIFLIAKNRKELKGILHICKINDIVPFIIGNGSNLLVSDKGIRGVVIKLEGDFYNINLAENNKIVCGAGVSLSKLCSFAYNNSLSGLEFAWGIPGTAGGAAFMNAGAYSGEMKNILDNCTHITPGGEFETLNSNALCLSYRHSFYCDNNNVITSITVKLNPDDKEKIKIKMDDYMNKRKLKQPLEYPSAGSVFKRPTGYFAGTLIEQCGLKGRKIGGAMVSNKHAGFIVNTGAATCNDVLTLIKVIKNEVKKQIGVDMECEVKFIGEI